MEDIIKKVYSHYLSDNELLQKEKEIYSLKDLKKFDFKGRNIELYYNENYFIKIDHRQEDQKKYVFEKSSLMLGKFPKEIIINNIIRKELEANVVKINNYYFNDKKQILVMENAGITFKDFIIKELNNVDLINDKVYEIIIILCILQNKFKFMHKDLKTENILMKKTKSEFNNYMIGDKEYKIKSHGYIPVFIDFATSTIFKIYFTPFEIYDTLKSSYTHNNMKNLKNNELMTPDFFLNKYLWYVRDINKYNYSFDLYNLIVSINQVMNISKIKCVEEYFKISGIKDYKYSESLLSPFDFLLKGLKSDEEILDIDEIVKNKDKTKIFIIINGLGNKLFALANLINEYKNYQLYFTEQISHHQTSRLEKKLKFVFPEIKNCQNPKLISFKYFDILKNKGIDEIKIENEKHFINPNGFIHQKEFIQKYYKMDTSYDYLLDKYDFENGIFVHVRYGDKFMINYHSLKGNRYNHFYTLLSPLYYIDNITKMLKEKFGKVYIFTDSVELTKCLFKKENKENKEKDDFIYVDEGSYETYYCFTKCKRLIISESTISIAAVWLNYNKDLKVIAPNFAIGNKRIIEKTFYVYPSTVTFESNKSYILDNIKQYDEIIKKCNINIHKFNNKLG
jgi:hypothetical protein